MMKYPGLIVNAKEITVTYQQWQDVGSGVFARTFVQAERLVTTTRGGPLIAEVHRRTIWSLSRGKVIDNCIADDVPDHVLNRIVNEPDDIRVELAMKDAISM